MGAGDDAKPSGGSDSGNADTRDAASEPESSPADRRFPRIKLATTVQLRFSSAGAVVESRTVDLSEGGVFIRMGNPRPEGTPIRLKLELGDHVRLEIGGVVVRCVRSGESEPPGIGVLFTEISPEDAEYLRTLVRSAIGH